jgi:hypothetical protein
MKDAGLLVPVSGTLLLAGCEMQNVRTYQMHCVHLPVYKQMDLNTLCGQNVKFINVKHCGALSGRWGLEG